MARQHAPVTNPTRILDVRGRRVILDSDLAELYGVTTAQLNQQVRRNRLRFPEDFAFQLAPAEWDNLKSQIATSSWGGRLKPPYVFAEHGALVAAGVLNPKRAIEVSIFVVRTFVAMREALADTRELARRLDELGRSLEQRFAGQDQAITEILTARRPRGGRLDSYIPRRSKQPPQPYISMAVFPYRSKLA